MTQNIDGKDDAVKSASPNQSGRIPLDFWPTFWRVGLAALFGAVMFLFAFDYLHGQEVTEGLLVKMFGVALTGTATATVTLLAIRKLGK